MRLPDGWSDARGRGLSRRRPDRLSLAGSSRGGSRRAMSLLVHGASGGVGLAAVQLGKASRRRGDRHRQRRCAAGRRKRQGGADQVVNYRTADFVAAVKELTDGQGADVDLRSGGRRGAGEIDARGRLRRAAAGRGLHLGRPEQAHVQPHPDQGPARSWACAPARRSPAIARPSSAATMSRSCRGLPRLGVMRPHISHRFPMERAADAFRALHRSSRWSARSRSR